LSLNLFIHDRAQYGGNIRLPRAVFYYQHLAQRPEAALFDSILLPISWRWVGTSCSGARTWLEPIIVLAALFTRRAHCDGLDHLRQALIVLGDVLVCDCEQPYRSLVDRPDRKVR
jgi:hypothetical protein